MLTNIFNNDYSPDQIGFSRIGIFTGFPKEVLNLAWNGTYPKYFSIHSGEVNLWSAGVDQVEWHPMTGTNNLILPRNYHYFQEYKISAVGKRLRGIPLMVDASWGGNKESTKYEFQRFVDWLIKQLAENSRNWVAPRESDLEWFGVGNQLSESLKELPFPTLKRAPFFKTSFPFKMLFQVYEPELESLTFITEQFRKNFALKIW